MQKKAKIAVATMLTRSREDYLVEDCTLSEEERWEKSRPILCDVGRHRGTSSSLAT